MNWEVRSGGIEAFTGTIKQDNGTIAQILGSARCTTRWDQEGLSRKVRRQQAGHRKCLGFRWGLWYCILGCVDGVLQQTSQVLDKKARKLRAWGELGIIFSRCGQLASHGLTSLRASNRKASSPIYWTAGPQLDWLLVQSIIGLSVNATCDMPVRGP